MAKVKGNSFEAREKKNKKRSSIVKMSELRVENFEAEKQEEKIAPKVQVKPEVKEVIKETKPEVKNTQVIEVPTEVKEVAVEKVEEKAEIKPVEEAAEISIVPEISMQAADIIHEKKAEAIQSTTYKKEEITDFIEKRDTKVSSSLNNNKEDFFNLNVKNDVFEGKMTTVRVYDDILDKLKMYASMKNYPIIEFTNKVITLGLDDFQNYGVLEISEIKLKNNTSRSIMYNLTDVMELKLNKYIDLMNDKGYKISRNVILNVILNETLKKFYV